MVNLEFKKCQKIIDKFVKQPTIWNREIKLAQELLKNHPDLLDIDLGFMLNSLAFFKTERGAQILKEKEIQLKNLSNLELPPKTEYNLSEEKFGKNKELESKANKTVMEFLNL